MRGGGRHMRGVGVGGGVGGGGSEHLVDVWVEEAVAEADRGRLVRVAVRKLDVYAPAPPLVRACSARNYDDSEAAQLGKRQAGWESALSLGPWKTT